MNKQLRESLSDLLVIEKKLGSGAFGTAYVVFVAETEKARSKYQASSKYALKVIKTDPTVRNEYNKREKLSAIEIRHMKTLEYNENHTNVVNILSYFPKDQFFKDSPAIIVMDFCTKGELTKYFKTHYDTFDPQSCLKQLLHGLQYIHSFNIIHRDIKSDNIFVTENSRRETVYKIGDFGVSKIANSNGKIFELGGTRSLAAPECIEYSNVGGVSPKRGITNKIDTWCLGLLFFVVKTGKRAFPGKKQTQRDEYQIRGFEGVRWISSKGDDLMSLFSKKGFDLLSKLLRKNPLERYCCEKALAHSFFNDLDGEVKMSVRKSRKRVKQSIEAMKKRKDQEISRAKKLEDQLDSSQNEDHSNVAAEFVKKEVVLKENDSFVLRKA